MNKEIVKRSFKRSINSYSENATIQKSISEKLIGFINSNNNEFNKIYEIGAGTGNLTQQIIQKYKINEYHVNDIVEEFEPQIAQIMQLNNFKNWSFKKGDAETIFPNDIYDLIITSSTIQWFNNLEFFFNNISKNLYPHGLLAFSTFGKQNLEETKTITEKGLNYPSLNEIKLLLQNKFEIIESFEEVIKLKFNNANDVLMHLRMTGVNGVQGSVWTKKDLANFNNTYNNKFAFKGGISLTYHPMYFIAQKK